MKFKSKDWRVLRLSICGMFGWVSPAFPANLHYVSAEKEGEEKGEE